jgi:hypothetical protein
MRASMLEHLLKNLSLFKEFVWWQAFVGNDMVQYFRVSLNETTADEL